MNGDSLFTCAECGAQSCYRKESKYPSKCVSENINDSDKDKAMEVYASDGIDKKIALAAAEIEGKYYGKLTRVEEIIEFAKLIGAQKIGVASCLGLISESRIFCRILKARGLEYRTVICKVGSVDKTEIGLPDDLKIQKGSFEAMCNPVLQAGFLNKEKTDLNVVVGLCVGHDSLFIRHSEAPVTTLIVKDRVLGHNPAAALYSSGFYYRRLLEEK